MRTGTLIFKDEFADSSRGIGIWSSDAVVSKIRAFWPFAGTFFHFATFSHRNELRDQSVFFASLRFASLRSASLRFGAHQNRPKSFPILP
jgi:hypothetical protein